MGQAKAIRLAPISSQAAREFVKKNHYSGKVVNNSNLHFGVFYNGNCEGVLQYGPPMNKYKVLNLIRGTGWSEMLELNRMAFSDVLPKNSESRAISISIKLIKKHYPHIKWILSFADGTQCGDGTIYRASGFMLTQIKKNTSIIRLDDGSIGCSITYGKSKHALKQNGSSGRPKNSEILPGFQFRYIYLIDKSLISQINFENIPYERIKEVGASMYKGKRNV